ncbi:MAG: PfkB family carbohydrate kinase [Akkermansia sp.]
MSQERSNIPILMAGTIALDTIITPTATADSVLGGSASFAATAASLFAKNINVLSIIGDDFPTSFWEELNARGINLAHVDHIDGPSFSWTGEYENNMNHRQTRAVRDSVMLGWKVRVPESLQNSAIVVATCMVPERQMELITQCKAPTLVLSDSMDKWITRQPEWLDQVISHSDITMMNDEEAKAYANTSNPITAGEYLLSKGAKHAIIKQGEYGSLLFSKSSQDANSADIPAHIFSCPAWPLRQIIDPTGAGDTFLGALAGYLSTLPDLNPTFEDMKKGIILATIAASFTCESFSADALFAMDRDAYNRRLCAFLDMLRIPDLTIE